jgi:hypothetical protein
MAGFATALPYISAAASIGGTLMAAKAQKSSGKAAVQQAEQTSKNDLISAEYEARQAEYLAGQSRAASQRSAYEERRMAALLASKTLAQAAGSGAGASDANVVSILNQIYMEGAYRSQLAMYEGEEQARSYEVSATARRLSGKSASSAALQEGNSVSRAAGISSQATLLSGASSFASKYGDLFGS